MLSKFHITPARGGTPSLVHVLDDEESTCYHVPANAAQLPATQQCPVKLRLCRNMATNGHCDYGVKCLFVHVHPDVIKKCKRSQVHANSPWKSIEEIKYPRHKCGGYFHVLKPKDNKPGDVPAVIPSELVLETRGSLDYEARTPKMYSASHSSPATVEPNIKPGALCAHFFINRACRLGNSCHFIHFANVDPCATPEKKLKKQSKLHFSDDSFNFQGTESFNGSDFLSDSGHSGKSSSISELPHSAAAISPSPQCYVHNPYLSYQQLTSEEYWPEDCY